MRFIQHYLRKHTLGSREQPSSRHTDHNVKRLLESIEIVQISDAEMHRSSNAHPSQLMEDKTQVSGGTGSCLGVTQLGSAVSFQFLTCANKQC